MRRFASFFAALLLAAPALAQTYPSPIFQSFTALGCAGYVVGNGASPVSCSATIPGSALASGAVAANLGFTPANKGGDTFTGSVTIPFTQSGSGAVARTVDARLKDTFSLKDFNVDPAGSSDSSVGIQAAVTYALSLTNGATIRIPAGTYKVAAQVSVPKTTNKLVTFECDAGAKFVADAALVPAMFYVGSNSVSAGGANFASLGCTYAGANTTSSRAFKLENANVSIFRNNAFRSMFLPVDMVSSYGVEFDGNMFETNTSYSIHSSTSAHHLFLHGNKFYNTGTAGTYTVLLDAATDNLVVRDNDMETGWTFLGMAGGSALTFEGNYLEYFSNTPFFFSSSVVGASIRQNWISLSGNLALGNIAGGEFKFNSSFNQTVTQGATATSLSSKGNLSAGTGATVADTIDQSFQATTLSNLPTTGTQYFGIGQSAFEVLVNTPVAKGGTLRGLYVTLGAAPGGTASYAFTLRVNGADTGVTCTVTGAATTCNDTTHTAAITAGQTWDIKVIATGTPAAQTALAAVGFVN